MDDESEKRRKADLLLECHDAKAALRRLTDEFESCADSVGKLHGALRESDERAGEEAIRNARTVAGGQLTIVALPHSRTAVVADRLEMLPDPPENVLVISPTEVNFYGSGALVLHPQ